MKPFLGSSRILGRKMENKDWIKKITFFAALLHLTQVGVHDVNLIISEIMKLIAMHYDRL